MSDFLDHIGHDRDEAFFDFYYGGPKSIDIDIDGVKMVGAIRVEYDERRDGWKISMHDGILHQYYVEDGEDWIEVGFFPCFMLHKKGED